MILIYLLFIVIMCTEFDGLYGCTNMDTFRIYKVDNMVSGKYSGNRTFVGYINDGVMKIILSDLSLKKFKYSGKFKHKDVVCWRM